MSRILKRLTIMSLVIMGCAIVVFGSQVTFAKGSGGRAGSPVSVEENSDIVAKAALEGVYLCATNNAYAGEFQASNYEGFVRPGTEGEWKVDAIKLPYNWGGAAGNRMNCRDVMFGNGGSSGLSKGFVVEDAKIKYKKKDKDDKIGTLKTVAEYFRELGYTVAEATALALNHSEQLVMSIPADLTDQELSACAGDTGREKKQPRLYINMADKTKKPDLDNIDSVYIAEIDSIIFPRVFVTQSGEIEIDESSSYNVPTTIGSGLTYYYLSNCGGSHGEVGFKVQIASKKGEALKWKVTAGSTTSTVAVEKTDSGAVYKYDESKWEGKYTDTRTGGDPTYTLKLYGNTNPIDSVEDSRVVTDYDLTRGDDGFMIKLLSGLNSRNNTSYAISSWSADKGISNLQLTRQEIFDLYRYYIQDVFKVKVICQGDSGYDYGAYRNEPIINWNTCGECRAFVSEGAKNSNGHLPTVRSESFIKGLGNVYGIDPSSKYFNYTITSSDNVNVDAIDDVISVLNGLGDLSDVATNDTCNVAADTSGGNSGGGSSSGGGGGSSSVNLSSSTDSGIVDCNMFKNVGAMQWVLCPTMNNMQYSANAIEDISDSWLMVNSDTYDNDSGAKKAWDIIRNIANVLMTLFLIIIILSQVTGYGIDNYGIKKMLPRLIIMAILVNLSFYICQLAIDLSNILGVGLRNMFGGVGNAIGGGSGLSFIGGMIAAAFGSAGAVGAGASAGLTAASVATVGAPLVVGLIVAVIVALFLIIVAVFTLFIMLAIRKLIVIVCIMLAPLAFAAYVLPNTQNLYKKWWELFKAALIIFPICGAFSGISYMLKSAVGNGDGLGIAGSLVMMVLPYVGFFLMPMLLKNAISALGKVGGALTSFGSTVRGGAQTLGKAAMKTAQSTDAFKDMQQEANRRRQQQRVDRIIGRINKDDLAKKLDDARDKDNKRSTVRTRRKLDKLERESRLLYDAEQLDTKMRTEQATADAGAVVPGDIAIKARATSAKEAQELKNYSDQYHTLTRSQVADELSAAVSGYDNNNYDSRLRLQAVLAEAERRKMDKEILLESGFTGLRFNADNPNDMKLLDQFGGSSDVVISQFGKQMSKYDGAMSLDDFVTSVDSNTNLRGTLDSKGPGSLIGANDDILEYLAGKQVVQGKYAGQNVVSPDQLIYAGAAATTDNKVQVQVQKMLDHAIETGDPIKLTGKQLAGQNIDTLKVLTKAAMEPGGEALREQIVSATNDIANSPELAASLGTNQKEAFDRVRGDDAFTRNNGVSATTSAVNSSARATAAGGQSIRTGGQANTNMSANPVGNRITSKITGDDLLNQNIDDANALARLAKSDLGVRKQFIDATNEIASDIGKSSMATPEQKAVWGYVRRLSNPNDTVFGGARPSMPNVSGVASRNAAPTVSGANGRSLGGQSDFSVRQNAGTGTQGAQNNQTGQTT